MENIELQKKKKKLQEIDNEEQHVSKKTFPEKAFCDFLRLTVWLYEKIIICLEGLQLMIIFDNR